VLLTLSNTVQNAIIVNDNSVLGGMIGATTLVVVNVLVVRYLYKHQGLDRRLEGEPIVLVENGRFLRKNCERALITEDEVMAAIRRQGAAELADVDRVVLETSGTVSDPAPPDRRGGDQQRDARAAWPHRGRALAPRTGAERQRRARDLISAALRAAG